MDVGAWNVCCVKQLNPDETGWEDPGELHFTAQKLQGTNVYP